MQLSLKKLPSVCTATDAIESGLPIFQKIIKSERAELLKFIVDTTVVFIENNFPTTKNPFSVAGEFADDLLIQRIDWRVPDISLFFRFIKTNVGVISEIRTYGNIITPIRLLELAAYYEDERCEARERLRKKEIANQAEEKKIERYFDPKYIELMKKFLADKKQVVYKNVPIAELKEETVLEFLKEYIYKLNNSEIKSLRLNYYNAGFTKAVEFIDTTQPQ